MLTRGFEPYHFPRLNDLLLLKPFEFEPISSVSIVILDVDFEESGKYFPPYITSWLSFYRNWLRSFPFVQDWL